MQCLTHCCLRWRTTKLLSLLCDKWKLFRIVKGFKHPVITFLSLLVYLIFEWILTNGTCKEDLSCRGLLWSIRWYFLKVFISNYVWIGYKLFIFIDQILIFVFFNWVIDSKFRWLYMTIRRTQWLLAIHERLQRLIFRWTILHLIELLDNIMFISFIIIVIFHVFPSLLLFNSGYSPIFNVTLIADTLCYSILWWVWDHYEFFIEIINNIGFFYTWLSLL